MQMLGEGGGVIIIRRKVAGVSAGALNRFAARVMAAAGIAGEVDVLLTDNRELRCLNRRFRNKDAATDVLSFPAEPGDLNGRAGDIAISGEMAVTNGLKLGHSAMEEIKILLLHGVLHLVGYDHERDDGSMERKEVALRRAFQLPVSLIERHGLDTKTGTKKRVRSQKT
jgi:probable rRNA maturation factor